MDAQWVSFLVGVLSSIVAAAVLALAVRMNRPLRKTFRRWLASGEGAEAIYDNHQDAENDVRRDVNSSRHGVAVLAVRGHSFTAKDRGEFKFILEKTNVRRRFLLLNPDGDIASPSMIAIQAKQKKDFEGYVHEIRASLSKIKKRLQDDPGLELRTYSFAPTFRMIVTDARLYVAFYDADRESTQTEMLAISKESFLYRWFAEYFDRCWNEAKPVGA